MCAIALSLAYPVREYIGQRRQIDQLLATQQSLSQQVKNLQAEQKQFSDPSYIEQQARDQLHSCMTGREVLRDHRQQPGAGCRAGQDHHRDVLVFEAVGIGPEGGPDPG